MKTVLVLAIVSAAFFLGAQQILANGESESWTRLFVRGAQADFSITHSTTLKTSGVVQVSQTIRASAFTGAEFTEKITLSAVLVICDNGEQCRKIWTVEAESFFDFPAPFAINEGDARVSAEVPALVTVYDFTDADNNGNFSEVTGSFSANLALDLSWDGPGSADSSTACGWDGDGARLAERHSKQAAQVSGTINNRSLEGAGVGSIWEREYWRIFKPGPETPC